MSGGLHAVVELTGRPEVALRREAAVVRRTAHPEPRFPAGLGVSALGPYWRHEQPDRTAGLVLGMGGPDDGEFAAAVERLRGVLLLPDP